MQAALPQAPMAEVDRLIEQSSRAAYSLDYAEAALHARRAVALAPDASRAHRALASALWVDVLFRRGAVTVDHYLGGITRAERQPAEAARRPGRGVQARARGRHRARRGRPRPQSAGPRCPLRSRRGLRHSGVVRRVDRGQPLRRLSIRQAGLRRAGRGSHARPAPHQRRRDRRHLPLPDLRARPADADGRLHGWLRRRQGEGDRPARGRGARSRHQRRRQDGPAPDLHARGPASRRHARRPRTGRRVPAQPAVPPRRGVGGDSCGPRHGSRRDPHPRAGAVRRGHPRQGPWRTRILALQARPGPAQRQPARRRRAETCRRRLASGPVDWVRGRIVLEQGKLADLAGRRNDAISAYRQAQSIGETSNDPACAAEAATWLRRPFTLPAK